MKTNGKVNVIEDENVAMHVTDTAGRHKGFYVVNDADMDKVPDALKQANPYVLNQTLSFHGSQEAGYHLYFKAKDDAVEYIQDVMLTNDLQERMLQDTESVYRLTEDGKLWFDRQTMGGNYANERQVLQLIGPDGVVPLDWDDIRSFESMKHYEGELGSFDYKSTDFMIGSSRSSSSGKPMDTLIYLNDDISKMQVPKGCKGEVSAPFVPDISDFPGEIIDDDEFESCK